MARRYGASLTGIALVGLGSRVWHTAAVEWDRPLGLSDAGYYFGQAKLFAEGQGFVNPFLPFGLPASERASAQHPPLFSTLLALGRLVGIDTPNGARVLCCVVGAAGVAAIGLLGRELAGPRAGLLAAGIAAVYPVWWVTDGLLLSEVLYTPLVALTLLFAYRLWRRPSWLHAGALGLFGGLAALTRSEALLLLVLTTVPLAVFLRGVGVGRRITLGGGALGVGVLVVAPWVAYNLARFREPVLVSTNDGITIMKSNCPTAYHGRYTGWFVLACWPHARVDPRDDESQIARQRRDLGLRYARHHLGDLPRVVAARVGRAFGFFRGRQTLELDAFQRWGDPETQAMLVGGYVALAGALAGALVLFRRGITLVPTLAAAITIVVTVAATYGLVRLRVPLDVVMVTLTGVAVDRLWPRPPAQESVVSRPRSTPARLG